MQPEPSSTRRPSVVLAIVLAPFRAIELARGWRRVGLLALYGLIAVVVWALLWRRSQLAGLPDIGEPFDVAAFLARARVPEERDAFVPYREAAQRYRDMNEAERASFPNANLAWPRADATLRRWVADNDEAISLLCTGSARPELFLEIADGRPELEFVRFQTALAENGTLANRLSWIGTAGLFKAGRLRAERDPAGAWTLLKAIVRASRHTEWAVPTAQHRSLGFMLVQYAREPVAEWARDPAVNAAMLRQALDDLAAAEALAPPLSAFYRQEYLGAVESMANLKMLVAARGQQRQDRSVWHPFALAPGLEVFLSGEPERSRRVLNLLVANDLAWCDRPMEEQPTIAVPRLHIYQMDPAAPAKARALGPEELARWADSSLITPILTWRLGNIEEMERIDHWSMRGADGGCRRCAVHQGDGPTAGLAKRGRQTLSPLTR